MQNLVIVESPTKARTLSSYLGSSYQVEASMGHVRDLPKAELGIDVENNFEPKYIIPKAKIKRVNELKKLIIGAKTLWLATDPDREGEAIAWHLRELLKIDDGKSKVSRVVFHEITPEAIKQAFEKPRDLDLKLVDAQQARRVLDRLVGYKLSPLLWKKVKSGLSAGRVQSVALRLIVEREREIEAFKPVEYWSIEAELVTAGAGKAARLVAKNRSTNKPQSLNNSLVSLEVRQSTTSDTIDSPHFLANSDFAASDKFIAALIEQNGKKIVIKNKTEADKHVEALQKASYQVSKITKKEVSKHPGPPFTTSTLQQTSSLRLGFTSKKTMMLAQFLYEHGLITYMRTDSVNLAPQAITSARDYISKSFGKTYLPPTARVFKTKSKLAQEAHEAIRPTNLKVSADELKQKTGITRDHIRLYDLIWKRMISSQMSEAVVDQTTVDIIAGTKYDVIPGSEATPESNERDSGQARMTKGGYLFRATGSVIKFDGWLKIYGKVEDEEKEEGDKILPELSEGEILKLLQLLPNQHFTEGPPRFNEASIIKKLEELGIGRPSTYATIISTILERFYIERVERRFFPTPLGIAVIAFLMKNFADILDYDFTARIEDELDEIAHGQRAWKPMIGEFYAPFEKKLESVGENAQRVKIQEEKTDQKCPDCGKDLVIKYGKFGKFLACSGFPDCKYTQNLGEKLNIKCPDCGGEVVLRKTRKGRPFYGCKNYPTCKFASWTKPKANNVQ